MLRCCLLIDELSYLYEEFDKMLEAFKQYEVSSNSKFCVVKSSKGFGDIDLSDTKQIPFEDKKNLTHGRMVFGGQPFAVLGQKVFQCQFGKDRKVKYKRAKKCDGECSEHGYNKNGKFLMRPSKTLDCLAKAVMRELVLFPDYKAEHPSGNNCKHIKEEILCIIMSENKELAWKWTFILNLPKLGSHEGHPINKEMNLVITDSLTLHLQQTFRNDVFAHQAETVEDTNRAFCHAAYCQYVLWVFGRLQRDDRQTVPACCVNIIRNIKRPSPSDHYIDLYI